MKSGLPLTVIEELMFYQDCPAYPYTCFVRFRFAGTLQRPALELAAAAALERHPLLAARIDGQTRRPRWSMDSRDAPLICWRSPTANGEFPTAEYLNWQQGGLRLIVVEGEGNSELVVQFQHACCDGLGIFQFVMDLLILYGHDDGDRTRHALVNLDSDQLLQRGRLAPDWPTFGRLLRRQYVGLAGVRQFLGRSPAPLIPHQRVAPDAATPSTYPAACTTSFPPEVDRGLRFRAKAAGVTVNDLLARDLFVALASFRRRRQLSDDDWLRLLIPVNLRRSSDHRLPAANVVSSVFLDRRGGDVAARGQLLTSIHDEMQVIKDNELGYTFVMSLLLRRLLPGGLRGAARGNRCNATAVFTNLGRFWMRTKLPEEGGALVCRDARLYAVDLLAPLTPYTCAAFAATWLGERLTIALHYDPRVLTAADAREVLDDFAGEICTSAGVPLPAATTAFAPA